MALKVRSGNVPVNENSAKKVEAHIAELDGREHEQILGHRDRFAEISYGIMQAWVGFLMVLTFAQVCLKPLKLGLETAEFIAVVTTTTAAVFGFGLLVGNVLFPKGGSERRRK